MGKILSIISRRITHKTPVSHGTCYLCKYSVALYVTTPVGKLRQVLCSIRGQELYQSQRPSINGQIQRHIAVIVGNMCINPKLQQHCGRVNVTQLYGYVKGCAPARVAGVEQRSIFQVL